MDRQGERNVENTMSGNDMQNRCGLKDTQELRSPPEVDWQQPESPQGGLRHLGEACGPRTGTSARGSDQRPAAVSAPAPRRHASRFRSGFGSRLRAALLSVLALVLGLPFAGPAAAQEVVEVPRAWELKPSGSGRRRRTNSACSSSPRRRATRSRRRIFLTTTLFVQGRASGRAFLRSVRSPRSSGSWAARATVMHVTIPGPPTHLRTRVCRSTGCDGEQSRRQLPGLLRRQLGQQEREAAERASGMRHQTIPVALHRNYCRISAEWPNSGRLQQQRHREILGSVRTWSG